MRAFCNGCSLGRWWCLTWCVVLQSSLTNQQWWRSGLEILVMGSTTAGIAYAIGYLVEEIMAASGHEVSCG